ncbi:MAG: hypothetical protein ACFFKA_18590 [Candidatus Thorarchaeota archaeon]
MITLSEIKTVIPLIKAIPLPSEISGAIKDGLASIKQLPLPSEIYTAISQMYFDFKSKYIFHTNPSRNKRYKTKQRIITTLNTYFNFESKEDELK